MKFKREHHNKILSVLDNFNLDILKSTGCYFGGGTAISLLLNEYRTSVDIDFLCSSREGFSELRELVFQHGIEGLFAANAPSQLRNYKSDRDGIRTVLEVDGEPIKFEIIYEGRIDLDVEETFLPVPTLSKECLFAEKLMANTDRGLDKTTHSKDIIDLIMMQHVWGDVPDKSLKIAFDAYKSTISFSFEKVFNMVSRDKSHIKTCFKQVEMDKSGMDIILNYLSDPNNSQYIHNQLKKMNTKYTV